MQGGILFPLVGVSGTCYEILRVELTADAAERLTPLD